MRTEITTEVFDFMEIDEGFDYLEHEDGTISFKKGDLHIQTLGELKAYVPRYLVGNKFDIIKDIYQSNRPESRLI